MFESKEERESYMNITIENANYDKIVCICGSTAFYTTIKSMEEMFKRKKWIVLTMEFFAHDEGIELDKGIKAKLDNLHLAKIQAADLVFIVDPGKYIGDSVKSEIDFASQLNKEIIFYSDYKDPIK